MTRGFAISVALLGAALAGAPVAYAATGAGMTGTTASPSPSTMHPQSSTMTNTGQHTAGAPSPTPSQATAKMPTKAAIQYVALSDQVRAEDIAAFRSSKVTLDRAISSAERKLDGRAVEAIFKTEPGRPHYVIRVMKGDRVTNAWVDASTGRVTHSRHSVALRRLYPGERAELMMADRSSMSLVDAVTFAQRESGNQPIAARIERTEGTRAYDIATVRNGALQGVWVSPDNPKIMASK